MATLVLGAVGTSLGGMIGGSVLGFTSAAIGGMIGASAGAMVDSWIVASMMPGQRIEGARLDALRVTSATEGVVIPRLYGRMRLGGNIIWATDFREDMRTHRQGGGKAGGPKITTTEYLYSASFAVALCEGPISGIGRIWVDGKPMDMGGVVWRWYAGDEAQQPDPAITARMGAGETPAYRGTAYVVFEELPLADYGNRLPQLSFEVFRPLADEDVAEGLVEAVTIIPASGEWSYATQIVRSGGAGESRAENVNAMSGVPDMVVALDRLEAQVPSVRAASLVVSWFGDDLRAGHCTIRPKVEVAQKATTPAWEVNGLARGAAQVVSQDSEGRPVYGGTPADVTVVQAIRELKQRGLAVTFYPFVMMDVPPGNALPDPWSDNAAGVGQPVFPWRGRITCSPAAGFAGSVDKTGPAAAQVAALFGVAQPGNFSVAGERVTWTGGADWGLRRMVLHYAHLCAAAGGVDAFLIGSEMRGLTTIRDGAASYPAVAALRQLAADVRSILGPATRISYAADWSEYFGHQPQDGSGDVLFHLDPLWADPQIDFIGIDNYLPLSDWRDGFEHADAQAGWADVHERAYLQANIEGGEGFDWFYASDGDRAAQLRTPIEDGAHGEPWVFRPKDLRGWWEHAHHDRPGGVRAVSPTAWVPEAKPIRFTELGCPAVDRGSNQPNVFHDPKSSESALPHFSRGWRDDAMQRAYLEAMFLYWREPAHNPVSGVTGRPMVDLAGCAAWTWDARPYPFFPERDDIWSDGDNWRLGHWLSGRLGSVSLAALVRHLCLRTGLDPALIDVSGLWGAVEGYVITALESPRTSITMLARHFGFDAVESEGVIRFAMRGRTPAARLEPDDLVAASDGAGGAGRELFELVRGQETELPQALKWQVARADEDYDSVTVEARRITVEATRIASDTFPVAVPPEEAERRCRRALMEAWTGRERASFRLPPSRLALDPGDVVAFERDEIALDLRLLSVSDGEARALEALREDRAALDLPPGAPRPALLARPVTFGPPLVEFLDLPQLSDEVPAHQPRIAAHAVPWPGELAVWRSPEEAGFAYLTSMTLRARMGELVADLYSGPVSRFDYGNAVYLELLSGTLESVDDLALLGGANALAVAQPGGGWEVLQFGRADLLAPGRYRLSRLLRGQRGTEGEMASLVPAGGGVVVLDDPVVPLPIGSADLGLPLHWRVGPASLPVADEAYGAQIFTPAGRGLQPFAPVHVAQPWKRARSPGDLTINWIRRDRALSADSWGAGEVPQSEEAEAWRVEIMAGAAVKRTLTAAAPAALYTAAQQVEDWGAPLGPGDHLDIRIAQIATGIGPGGALVTTLWF